MHNTPPKWAQKILRLFCADHFIDELEGDLYELYERNLEQLGARKAKLKYVFGVLFSFRLYRARLPFIIKIQPMIKFNLLIAFRHGIKNLSFSLINLLGLSLGIAATLYISLYVLNELNVDQFHKNRNGLYRVLTKNKKASTTPTLLGEMISTNFPELEVCRMGNDPIKIGEEHPLLIEDFYWTDATFFQIFSFPLLYGNPQNVLNEPNSIVLTASIAEQLFPEINPLGQIIDVKIYDSDEVIAMKITGIAEDPPANSSIQFKGLGSMHNAEKMYASLVKYWGFNWLSTYVHAPNISYDFTNVEFPSIMKAKLTEQNEANMTADLQPFKDMYLHSQDIERNKLQGSIQVLYIMGSIGFLILVISLLNYINLNTARVFTRLDELKIKQALGSNYLSILWQYLIEAMLYVSISTIIGVFLIAIFINPLNQLFEIEMSFSTLTTIQWVYILSALVCIGLLAGLVSAIKLIKGLVMPMGALITGYKEKGTGSRKVLMGVQYIITLFLTTIAMLVYLQFNFLSNYNLGFDAEQLIYISVDDRELQKKIATIKTQMLGVSGVVSAAISGEKLPSAMNNTYSLSWQGLAEHEKHGIDVVGVDKDYFDVVGIELVEGAQFIHDYAIDSARTIILNQQAKILIGDSALVGKTINVGDRERNVRGIIKNHHHSSLHSKLTPVAYFICPPGSRTSPDNIYLRIETGEFADLQQRFSTVWQQFSTDPIDINYVDQNFANAYRLEKRVMLLANTLTIIAIIVAFLGLFGLITFTVQQKMKELCVRKILGAPLLHITKILSKDFIIIFSIAIVVAAPLTYMFGERWLANYPYNIGFNFMILLSAILICLLISGLVIGIRIIKLSNTNPTSFLRSE